MSYATEPDSDSIKMFIGQISKSMDDDELKRYLEEFGPIFQCSIIRDKMSGESKGCGFVTYFSRKDALTAQMALHNLKVMPGLSHPIQMKPADVQRNPLEERRLFVGMLPKSFVESDVIEMFEPFGKVDDCTVMRESYGQGESKGCAFVTFSSKENAEEAIQSLHNSRTMAGCRSPLVVKYADTQKEKDLRKIFNKQGQSKQNQFGNAFSSGLTQQQQQQQQLLSSLTNQSMPMNNFGLSTNVGNQNNLQPAQIQQLLTAALATSPLLQTIPGGLAAILGNLPGMPAASIFNTNQTAAAALQASQTAQILALLQQISSASTQQQQQQQQQLQQQQQQQQTGFAGNQTVMAGFSGANNSTDSSIFGHSGSNSSLGQSNYMQMSEPVSSNSYASSSMSVPEQLSTNTFGNDLMSKAYPGIQQYFGPDGANLFIYHIPMEFRDGDLLQMFSPFGKVVSANVFFDKKTGQSKCFGFVSYESPNSAQMAIQAMNGFQIGSKRLKVTLKTSKSENKPY